MASFRQMHTVLCYISAIDDGITCPPNSILVTTDSGSRMCGHSRYSTGIRIWVRPGSIQTLVIAWHSRKARRCAQAGRSRFSFRQVKRGCLLDGDLDFRTDSSFTWADRLCTESAEVTSRTHRKTNDLNRYKTYLKNYLTRLTDTPDRTRQGGGLFICVTRWEATTVG